MTTCLAINLQWLYITATSEVTDSSKYTLTVIFSSNGPSMVSSLPLIKDFAGAGNAKIYRLFKLY